MKRLFLFVSFTLLAVCGRAADPTPSTPVCGLDGFDLDLLDQASYWNMTIEANDCIIPAGYAETNISSCYVYFSICKTLPESICTGHSSSSTCQVVTTNDGQRFTYDIGDYQQNVNEFSVIGGPDTVGFMTLRRGGTITSRLCNDTFETALTWACNSLSNWDPQAGDANPFITSITGRTIDDCFLEVEFGYNGACYETPTLAPERCQLDPYNLEVLSSVPYWSATVDPVLCYGDQGTSCTFYLSFCHTVPPSVDEACYGAAVCQTGQDGDGNSFGYSMGQFNPQFTSFFENDDVVDGGFHMDVENGSRPDDGRCNTRYGIRTRVILVCNSSVHWPTTNDLTGLLEVAYPEATDPCEYVIFAQYAGACIPVGPLAPEALQMSPVGWILMGIFFFVVAVYLVIGVGFNFFVRGERGFKVIPNYEFWTAFVMLVLEGCKFSLDIVTCFMFKNGRIKSPGKGGIEYDNI